MLETESMERKILSELLDATLIENRRKRRWSIFFKLIYLFIVLFIFWNLFPSERFTKRALLVPHAALIDIHGTIDENGSANADDIATSLNAAFADKSTRGILLRINSPGGSPVQASYVYDEIHRQQKKHPNIKVYAICVDVCASAAYFIASAADFIYANPASLVGSIGVMMEGFGFNEAIHKIGVDRRLVISGKYKDFLDPFSPLKPDQQQLAQAMIDNVYNQFTRSVEIGRGNRLKKSPLIFSGLAWTGQQSLSMGLIDGLGSAGYVAREIIKTDTIIDYTIHPSFIEQIANRFGASFATVITSVFNRQLR